MGGRAGKINVVIAGGGMAGMTAAVMLAEAGACVTLIERQERVGRKLLLTGSGKCNISNKDMGVSHYICDDREKLGRWLESFGYDEAEAFMKSLGVVLCERKGYAYPVTRQAATVLDALRRRMEELSVKLVCGKYVNAFETDRKGCRLICADKSIIRGDVFIFACGGLAGIYDEERFNGYDVLKAAGHKMIRTSPGLVQIEVCEELKSAAGVRCDAQIRLLCEGSTVAEESGELQITAGAFSGIPVFQLSRYLEAKKEYELAVDVLPFIDENKDTEWLYGICRERTLEEALRGLLNKNLASFVIKQTKRRPNEAVSALGTEGLARLIRDIKALSFRVSGTRGYKNAQISMGGISLKEVDEYCRSICCDDLYVIGEMLNACGECGGYNLHFAMASAHAAAEGICRDYVQD